MKKALVILLAVVIIGAATLFALFYFKPKFVQNIFIPKIEQVGSMKIRLAGDTAYADVLLYLKNKGPFRIHIDSLQYHIMFDTLVVLSREQGMKVIVNPGEADTLHLPVRLPFKRIAKRIAEIQDHDSLDITTEARVVYNTVLGKHALPHKKTNRIGMLKPPRFTVEKVTFRGFKKGAIRLNADITMHNRGKLDLLVNDLRFELKIADLVEARGALPGEVHVMPHTVISKTIPIEAKLEKPLKTLARIATGSETPYHLTLTGHVYHEKLGGDKTEISLVKDGKVDLGKAVK